eukprot:TRINITY_DN2521_c0_g1_i2.p1 TRINITY_DN2521_c0_g1~~TRINITY_DN2521_c0_g1_i2.p1  ORF type:complete len:940 (+),score=328.54 TRINITY_DN2521_c0_g1_i2:228-2822(+)
MGAQQVDETRSQGDAGLQTCLTSGEQDVRLVSARYLTSVVGQIEEKVSKVLDGPERTLREFSSLLRRHHPDETTSPTFVDKTMRLQMRTRMDVMVDYGVSQVAYYPLWWSPSHPPTSSVPQHSTWGPYIGFLLADEAFGTLPTDGSNVVLTLESRLENGDYGMNWTHLTFGESDEDGYHKAPNKKCENYANFAAGEVFGTCRLPNEFFYFPMLDEMKDRMLYNTLKPTGTVYPAEEVVFSPVSTTQVFLTIYAAMTFTHPSMLNLSPRQGGRYATMVVSVEGKQLSDIFTETDLPAGSHVYCVERNPHTGVVGTLVAYNQGRLMDRFVVLRPGSAELQNITTVINVQNHTMVQNSTNLSVVGHHSRYVFSHAGNYSEMADMTATQFHPWVSPLGEEYWTITRVVTRRQLTFFVSLLVPRGAVMDAIDVSTSAIRKKSLQERNDLDEKRSTMMVIVLSVTVGVVAVLLVLAVIFTRKIIAPLHVLRVDMANVAVMNLEAIDLCAPSSRLSEVKDMQQSFQQMVRNLIEYRNYMPQSVLVKDTDDDTSVDGSASMHFSRTPSQSHSLAAELSDKTDSHSTGNAPGGLHHPFSTKVARVTGGVATDGIRVKNVSLVYFNVKNWHHYVEGANETELTSVHTNIISALLQSIQDRKGVSDLFSGDRLMGAFNAYSQLRTHKVACVQAALRARERFTKIPDYTPELSFACATGDAKVGSMGCQGMKKVMITSPVMPWVVALERYNRRNDLTGVADHFMVKDMFTEYVLKCTDAIVYRKRHLKNPTKVYEVLEKSQIAAEEWMYQMDKLSKNPYTKWNKVFDLVLKEDYDKAEEMFADVTCTADKGYAKLQDLVASRSYTPVVFDLEREVS